MNMMPGYEQPGFGSIPQGWDAKPLKGQVSIAHGFAFASQHFASSGKYRLTTPGHFHEEGGFRDIGAKQKFYTGPVPSDYVLEPGDLIVAMTEQADGLLGSAALIPPTAGYLLNQRLGRVRTLTSGVHLPYLFWVSPVVARFGGDARHGCTDIFFRPCVISELPVPHELAEHVRAEARMYARTHGPEHRPGDRNFALSVIFLPPCFCFRLRSVSVPSC